MPLVPNFAHTMDYFKKTTTATTSLTITTTTKNPAVSTLPASTKLNYAYLDTKSNDGLSMLSVLIIIALVLVLVVVVGFIYRHLLIMQRKRKQEQLFPLILEMSLKDE